MSKISSKLGANRTFNVKKKMGTPLSWLHLAHEVKEILISSGGRPSNPQWDIKRLIPFKQKNWDKLSKIANDNGISPSQLAAYFIEKSL